jgi:hypothetical protein
MSIVTITTALRAISGEKQDSRQKTLTPEATRIYGIHRGCDPFVAGHKNGFGNATSDRYLTKEQQRSVRTT